MDPVLTTSPEAFPLRLDPYGDAAFLIRLDEAGYRAASFLDDRIAAAGAWTPWPAVEEFAARLEGDSDFIFHIGHVGSTLLSRLLGMSPRIFALREPAVLRTLAQMRLDLETPESLWSPADFDRRTQAFLRLFARVWRPGQRSLVKATSFVGEISGEIMGRSASSRAIMMFAPPEAYLATILGGPASRVELRANAQARLRRLHARVGGPAWRLSELSVGETAAMSWASEISALADTAGRFADRVRWLDFEAFLARPEEGLEAALRHLHGEAPVSEVQAMASSPDFGRYAKATEHPYDADLRRRVLDQARAEFGEEIRRGMAWLNAAGQRHGVVADAARAVAAARRA